jgi:sirohydrochlorin cobaltochelatase
MDQIDHEWVGGKKYNLVSLDYPVILWPKGCLLKMKAIILFGHGARDIRWREPFDRLAELWRSQSPSIPVELAFLEFMQPSLEVAVASLFNLGASQITVVPIFFGQGGHLRNDFPLLLDSCRKKFPSIALSSTPAVGENLAILQAIADIVAESINSTI